MKQLVLPFFRSFSGIPRVVWLLSGVSLINRTGTMVVCFLTLYLTQRLGFDLRSAGYVLVFYGLGTIAGLYTGGWLTDKIGYRRVQLWSLVLGGLSFILTIYVHDFWSMSAMTFLFAFLGDMFRPANQVAIRMNSDDATRTRAFSLMRVAVNMAVGIALVLGGFLVSLGWEWLFWVDGLTCFAAAIMLYFFLKEEKTAVVKSEEAPQYLADKKGGNQENALENEQKRLENASKIDNFVADVSPYRDPDYLLFAFLTLIGATVFFQLLWTVPVFFKEVYGWNESQIGMASALNTVIVMVVEMPLIYRIENRRPAMWFVRLGIACYGLSHLAFFLPTNLAVLAVILYMIPASLGETFVMPFSTSWATKRAGTARQGQYMGLYGMAYSVSNVIAPLLGTQVIAAFGYNTLWLVLLAMSAVAFGGFWYLEHKKN
jgi:predicted MFS family arabinose efflux permease